MQDANGSTSSYDRHTRHRALDQSERLPAKRRQTAAEYRSKDRARFPAEAGEIRYSTFNSRHPERHGGSRHDAVRKDDGMVPPSDSSCIPKQLCSEGNSVADIQKNAWQTSEMTKSSSVSIRRSPLWCRDDSNAKLPPEEGRVNGSSSRSQEKRDQGQKSSLLLTPDEVSEEAENADSSISLPELKDDTGISSEEGPEDFKDEPEEVPKPPSFSYAPLLTGCRHVDVYKRLNKISEGTYGAVYRAKDLSTGEIVALKHIKYHERVWEEGFPLTSLREISILIELKHEHIVNVNEVVVGSVNPNQVFMVMEYIEHEIKLLLERDKPPFSLSERKTLMIQLLSAVEYMHRNWVVHRDLKTSNLLYSNKGVLKVCDFGMARKFGDPIRPYTHNVVTLWYRAPELLLGQTEYTEAVDLWSVGCIIAEILLKRPLFNSKNETEALNQIFKLCGTPSERTWPGFNNLPVVVTHRLEFPKHPPSWRSIFPVPRTHLTDTAALSASGLNLLRSLMTLDPSRRISAKDALQHPFFSEKPLPQRPHLMPSAPDSNVQAREPRHPEDSLVENDFHSRNNFHSLDGRFGGRVDPRKYLTELESVNRKAQKD